MLELRTVFVLHLPSVTQVDREIQSVTGLTCLDMTWSHKRWHVRLLCGLQASLATLGCLTDTSDRRQIEESVESKCLYCSRKCLLLITDWQFPSDYFRLRGYVISASCSHLWWITGNMMDSWYSLRYLPSVHHQDKSKDGAQSRHNILKFPAMLSTVIFSLEALDGLDIELHLGRNDQISISIQSNNSHNYKRIFSQHFLAAAQMDVSLTIK